MKAESLKRECSRSRSRSLTIEEWRSAIYAKIVQKVGTRRYWETWAKDVADIASRHITRITTLVETSDTEHRAAFEEFLTSLRQNLNPSITQTDAIEMLSQHLITKPVFDALFEDYAFSKHNPVSLAMQAMLDVLEGQSLEKETQTLDKFYESVRQRASGIDNAAGKQKIIIELYDKFFKSAFPRTANRLGIVYTPIEVVDFIIHSANDALQREFGASLSDEGVHILDPFTGTGTFMIRLMQSGLIRPEDLLRKYTEELHANEIVLLAYYIAAINIEATFHELAGTAYQPFDGIVLTDTFQMTEGSGSFAGTRFPENNERVAQQNATPINVIIGNPPYSVGQDSQNDSNQNLKYPLLDESIRKTYAAQSTAKLKNSLYDSYIRGLRWASDRIGRQGIICFVTSGSFIDGNAAKGIRMSLMDEFTSIHCFNLRGNARTSGEDRRKERGNVFGVGSRTPIAITLLAKNPEKVGGCRLHYYDIGDFLTQEEKLRVIANFSSAHQVPWTVLIPNIEGDWTNQRRDEFSSFTVMGTKSDLKDLAIFSLYSNGVKTNRDSWTYNFSLATLSAKMLSTVDFYNDQVEKLKSEKKQDSGVRMSDTVSNDATQISWSDKLLKDADRLITHTFSSEATRPSMYRPFCKQWLYFNRDFNERMGRMAAYYPEADSTNLTIYTSGPSASKPFSAIITDAIPDFHLCDSGQAFSLYYYEKINSADGRFPTLSSDVEENRFMRRDAISDRILTNFRELYGLILTKTDIFYYVYGILHSTEYKQRFGADLKKMLPRVPMATDFWPFSEAGRALAEWHLNYESVTPHPLKQSSGSLIPNPGVHKMKFAKRGKVIEKTTIIYNGQLTLSGIPLEAYDYIVNGRPAIEWIMDRYQYKIDDDSQIVNDPNEWSDDPLYIINLVKRMVTVSLETMKIVDSLPALNERT